jgi:membrane protein YdbS with pleckstrin-like domain
MQPELVLRKSPFVFLRRVFWIEVFLAFVPLFLAALLNAQAGYEATALSRTVPYPILQAVLVAVIQTVIIGLSFVSWYLPTYQVNREQVIYKPGPLFEDQVLANTPAIVQIAERQGPLGRRLGYGSLAIDTSDQPDQAHITDVPNPRQVARQIEAMVEPERAPRAPLAARSAQELIASGESQYVEFKSSLLWDYRRQSVNKDLYEPIMKNVVAFMNTTGGAVLIGVGDEGEILGLDNDFKALRKPNVDGFENSLTMAFNKMIGPEHSGFLRVSFPEIDGKAICLVLIDPSPQPVFLTFKGQESFYIRAGNSAQPLSISQAIRYIRTRFVD